MLAAYVIVTVLAAAANVYAATNDFTRPAWLLTSMSKLVCRNLVFLSWASLKRRVRWDC